MKPKVGIVGGGPGGLTLARLLQMGGAEVSVFERDPFVGARFEGGSLDMAPSSGRKAIAAAGLETEFRQLVRKGGDAYTVCDHTGRITYRTPPRLFGSGRPEIDRADLRAMLLSSLAPGTVQWDRRFVGLSDSGAGKRVLFEDGSTAEVDLLVGADGARSRVRPFVVERAPEYSGVVLLQGDIAEPAKTCPEILDWVRGANLFVLGHSIGVFVQARSSGGLSLYVSQEIPDQGVFDGLDLSTPKAVQVYASRLLRGWSPAFVAAVEVSAPLIVKPLVHTAPDQSWPHQQNITLIGDAAHVMPPFGGEGANMAMLDALLLSRAILGSSSDLARAIARYEPEMLARTGAVQRSTAALQEIFHLPDAANRVAGVFGGPF